MSDVEKLRAALRDACDLAEMIYTEFTGTERARLDRTMLDVSGVPEYLERLRALADAEPAPLTVAACLADERVGNAPEYARITFSTPAYADVVIYWLNGDIRRRLPNGIDNVLTAGELAHVLDQPARITPTTPAGDAPGRRRPMNYAEGSITSNTPDVWRRLVGERIIGAFAVWDADASQTWLVTESGAAFVFNTRGAMWRADAREVERETSKIRARLELEAAALRDVLRVAGAAGDASGERGR